MGGWVGESCACVYARARVSTPAVYPRTYSHTAHPAYSYTARVSHNTRTYALASMHAGEYICIRVQKKRFKKNLGEKVTV